MDHFPSSKELTCNVCDQTFGHISSLRRHKKRDHERNEDFTLDNKQKVRVKPEPLKTEKREVCGETFSNESSFSCHMKSKHERQKETPQECETCGKTFQRHCDLSKHLKNSCTDLTCRFCDIKFSVSQNLRRHQRNVHGMDLTTTESEIHKEENNANGKINMISCPVCAKQLKTESCLSRHKHVCAQTSETSNKYCKECNKFFCDPSSLKRHMKRIHSITKESRIIVIAKAVDSLIDSKSNFKELNDNHSEDSADEENVDLIETVTVNMEEKSELKSAEKTGVFQCKICALSFETSAGLSGHRKIHISNRQCQYCDKVLPVGPEWLEHLKSHKLESDKIRFCHICGNSFQSYGGFYKHMKIHDGRVYSCELCSKKFTASYSLKIHMYTHKGEKPCQCEICGSRFSQQCHLKRHMASHKGEKKYPCQTCNKSFMDTTSLRIHERIHTGHKPYECTLCSYKSSTMTALKTHKKTHFMKRDFQCKICERTFTQKHALQRHEAMHENQSSKVKPGFVTKPSLFCNKCPKGFTTKRGLVRHMQKHTKGLLPVLRKDENDDEDEMKEEKVPSLISSVHGHYQSDNETKALQMSTHDENNTGTPKQFIIRDGNSKAYHRPQPSVIISPNHENRENSINKTEIMQRDRQNLDSFNFNISKTYLQSVSNEIQDKNYISSESADTVNVEDPRSQHFGTSLLKENQRRFLLSEPVSSPGLNPSLNTVVTTCIDYGTEGHNNDKLTSTVTSVKQFREETVINTKEKTSVNLAKSDKHLDYSASTSVETARDCVAAIDTSEMNEPKLLNAAEAHSVNGLNTLSAIICNLEDRKITGWESFRFSEQLNESAKKRNYANDISIDVQRTMNVPREITWNTTIYEVDHDNVVDSNDLQHCEVLNTAEEGYENLSFESNKEKPTMSQPHQSYNTETYECQATDHLSNSNESTVLKETITQEKESVTVIKIKSEAEPVNQICIFCSLSFESESALRDHVEEAHKEEILQIDRKEKENISKSDDLKWKKQCLKCKKKFCSLLKLKKHLKHCEGTIRAEESRTKAQHKKVNRKEYTDICKKKYAKHIFVNSKDNINKKVRESDSGNKIKEESKYHCKHCSQSFSYLSSLKFHECKHNGPSSHVCEVCGRIFNKMFYLKRHMKQHENETRYCDKCGKMFKKESLFIRHMRQHMGLDPYPCTFCGKIFRCSSNLKRHLKSHVDGSKDTAVVHSHYCHLCGKGYTAKTSLQVHLNTHNGVKPHKCETCQASFTQLSHLNRHIKSHKGERTVKCDTCGKMFYDTSTMNVHIRSHTGEKPYQCKVCGQSFTQIQNLRVHERKHEGIKMFKCSKCEQEFSTKMSLERHGKRHEREGFLDPEMKSKRYMTVKRMRDKVVPCPSCNKHFTTRKSMLAHQRHACSHRQELDMEKSETNHAEAESDSTNRINSIIDADANEQNSQKATSKQMVRERENRNDTTSETAHLFTHIRRKGDETKLSDIDKKKGSFEKHRAIQEKALDEKTKIRVPVVSEEIGSPGILEQDISNNRSSYEEIENISKLQNNAVEARTFEYPTRTVIYYSDPGGSVITCRKDTEPRNQHPVQRVYPTEHYEMERNVLAGNDRVRHLGDSYNVGYSEERKINESVDNIAESMVSFMKEKDSGKTFTEITDSPRIRIYTRDNMNADSPNCPTTYVNDGSEMSIVHVVEEAPYTEIIIEDVQPDSSCIDHSSFVPGYHETVRFSNFSPFTTHASNSALSSSVPATPPGSFALSSTSQSNVITSVFAPGMLGVPLNLVTLGPVTSVPVEQTSQDQYFHQEPQWKMPCP